MNHIEKLNWRYATKKFDPNMKLSEKDLDTISEILRMSASSFGLQPWKFIIISNQEVKAKLQNHSWNQKQIVDCSHLIVFCGLKKFNDHHIDRFINDTAKTRGQDLKGLDGYKQIIKDFFSKKSKDEVSSWVKNQVYLALGSLLTSCAELGIDACPMEGFIQSEYDKVLELDKHGLTSACICPVGFRAGDDEFASLAKVRYPKEQVITYID